MGGITQIIFSIFGSLLYPLFGVIYLIIDTVQNIFYAFAGLGTISFGGRNFSSGSETVTSPGLAEGNGADNANGIIYYLFRSETAKNILVSMVILGVFLLVIFTVMAFIKNMYAAKQKKWQDILSSTLKGAINFLFLPVMCLLGVIGGNALLQVLNDATATSNDVTISRQLFIASSYSANKFRDSWDGDSDDVTALQDLYNKTFGTNITLETGRDGEFYAEYLDEIFTSKNGPEINSWWSVDSWYHLWSINYLLLGAGGVFLLFALLKISFGALKRLFMLLLLFVISPAVCSLYPLDEGSAVNKWRSEFIKQFFSVYGAVVGLNLFFAVVPLINSINIGSDALGIVPLLITIAGLYMVSDAIRLITSFIPGAGDAYGEGSGLAGNAKRRALQGAKVVGGGSRKVVGAFSRAGGVVRERRNYITENVDKKLDKTNVNGYSLKRQEGESKAEFKERKKSDEFKEAKRSYNEQYDTLKKDAKNTLGGGSVKGFFGSLAGSAGGGLNNLGGTLADKMGVGRLSDWKGSVASSYEAGKDAAKAKAAPGLLLKDLQAGNFDKAAKVLGGKNGDKVYEAVKDDKDFKDAVKDYKGVKSASDLADIFRSKVEQGKMDAEREKLQLDYDRVQEAIVNAINGAKPAGSTAGIERDFLKQALKGEEITSSSSKAEDQAFARAANAAVQDALIRRDAAGNAVRDASGNVERENVSFMRGQLDVLTTRAFESGKDLRAKMAEGSEGSGAMDKYLGYLNDTLKSLKNDQEIKGVRTATQELAKIIKADDDKLLKAVNKAAEENKKALAKSVTKKDDGSKK